MLFAGWATVNPIHRGRNATKSLVFFINLLYRPHLRAFGTVRCQVRRHLDESFPIRRVWKETSKDHETSSQHATWPCFEFRTYKWDDNGATYFSLPSFVKINNVGRPARRYVGQLCGIWCKLFHYKDRSIVDYSFSTHLSRNLSSEWRKKASIATRSVLSKTPSVAWSIYRSFLDFYLRSDALGEVCRWSSLRLHRRRRRKSPLRFGKTRPKAGTFLSTAIAPNLYRIHKHFLLQ